MKSSSFVYPLFIVLLFSLFAPQAEAAHTTGNFSVEIVAIDPASRTTLAVEDKLYVKVSYESEMPLRFQADAIRNGSVLDVGKIKNRALLHPPGKGEAMAWVMYLNTTHIDAVRISVFNEQWQQLFQLTKEIDILWQEDAPTSERQVADWVKPLDRVEKRLTDFFYDPAPQRFGNLYDAFFYVNLTAIPCYILFQLHMLFRYRYRWRELALVPVFPYLIVAFYFLVGLNIEQSLLITFLFRYTFAALLWLCGIWLAKRYWQDKLPPPKLYKPPKA